MGGRGPREGAWRSQWGKAGPALPVFSEADNGCSMSLEPPVLSGSCLEEGGFSRHSRGPG